MMKLLAFANFIYGKLYCCYVHPESQHKGYGSSLLKKGLEQFDGKYDAVFLEVDNKIKMQFNTIKIMILKSYVLINQKCMENNWI